MYEALTESYELVAGDNKTLSEAQKRARDYARQALSKNTWKAYQCDLDHFTAWGGKIPSTPEKLTEYLSTFAGELAISTLSRRLASINKAHEMAGHPSPTTDQKVRLVMKGIRRAHSSKQKQASPLLRDDLISICSQMTDELKCKRDKALLLIGFAGALRRSELVALNIDDIEFLSEGVVLHIRKSKTDQEGRGRKIAIPKAKSQSRICPVKALKEWMDILPSSDESVFRSVRKGTYVQPTRLSESAVSVIIKSHVKKIGLDPENYSGHSLRAGFCTSAAMMGLPEWKIMKQSGHKSHNVMMRYIRDARLFEDNPLDIIF